jgi:hypothetical protein
MNNVNLPRSGARFSKYLPILALTLCLTVLGIGIYRKAARAIAPPINDPMSYYMKGAMVWKEWRHGRLVNPLNVPPTSRPPGTMLLTSPWGFSPDFRPFYFRSTFIPVVVFVIAFWILAESKLQQPRQRWANLVGALMLVSLPMFYQFERNSAFVFTADWGDMDCFLGAVGALAAALLLVSVLRRSIGIAALGIVAGALTLLVKPAGLILMPVLGALWLIELAATYWPIPAAWRENKDLRWYSIRTLALLVLVFSGVTAASFGSEYLSLANISIAYNAQKVVIEMYKNVSLASLILYQVHEALGWHWLYSSIAATLLMFGAILFRASRRSLSKEDFRFLAALASLVLGIVWWVKFAGPAQIRYVYPFLMIFLVVLLPEILSAADRMLPEWSRRALAGACIAPMAIITVLMFMNAPPLKGQLLAGVDLSTGQFSQEIKMADFLVDQGRKQGRNLKVYNLPVDHRSAMVETEGMYANLLHPEEPTFNVRQPNDWVHPIMVRRAELVQADFILFRPVRDAARQRTLLTLPVVNDPGVESELFSAWLTQAAEEQGIQTVLDGDLRLAKVIDHAKLDAAFGRLASRHSWRDLFDAENKEPVVLTQDALDSAADRSVPSGRDVRFGDRFLLRSAELTPGDGGLKMDLFWESLVEQPLKYFIFVHLIDRTGKILAQADYEQGPGARTTPRLAKAGEIWRDTVPLSPEQLKGVDGIAFGIWEPPGTFLAPDRGDRDWDGRRLILDLPRDLRSSAPIHAAHYEGSLDYAGCDMVAGWGWDASTPNGPIRIRISEDGKSLMTLTADRPRPDLKAAGKGTGEHAFVLNLPEALKDGRPHAIAAKADGSEFELPNSPRQITCR